jgi:predicted Zn-dependent protease
VSLLDPELAARAIERALARGGDLGEVYAEDRTAFGVALDDGRVERPQSGSGRGASVRVVAGDATYFGHVDGIAEADLLDGLRRARAQARERGWARGARPVAPLIHRPRRDARDSTCPTRTRRPGRSRAASGWE